MLTRRLVPHRRVRYAAVLARGSSRQAAAIASSQTETRAGQQPPPAIALPSPLRVMCAVA